MGSTLNNVSVTLPDGGIRNADISNSAAIESTKLAKRTLQKFNVPITSGYVWDAPHTRLPVTAANDDLGLVAGTWPTDVPVLQSGDGKATTINRYAGYELEIPHNYSDGDVITLQLRAGMVTTVSDDVATVDATVYVADGNGGAGSDINQTAAVSINSLTKTEVNFTLDTTAVDPGDRLFIRLHASITDAATGTAVIVEISDIKLVCTTQG